MSLRKYNFGFVALECTDPANRTPVILSNRSIQHPRERKREADSVIKANPNPEFGQPPGVPANPSRSDGRRALLPRPARMKNAKDRNPVLKAAENENLHRDR
jgi:hypothetical protein